MSKIITATFKTRTAAEQALSDLDRAGFRDDQISMVVTEETRGKSFGIEEHSKADEGAAAGATFGGVVGAILGGIFASGTIAVPGIDLVITGALASGLAGFGAGAFTGGLVGLLVGMGIPEHEAKLYQNRIKAGHILLAVETEHREGAEIVERILDRADAYTVAA